VLGGRLWEVHSKQISLPGVFETSDLAANGFVPQEKGGVLLPWKALCGSRASERFFGIVEEKMPFKGGGQGGGGRVKGQRFKQYGLQVKKHALKWRGDLVALGGRIIG